MTQATSALASAGVIVAWTKPIASPVSARRTIQLRQASPPSVDAPRTWAA